MTTHSPFGGLAAPSTPTNPDRAFGRRLRADLVAALAPDIDLPERNADMTDLDSGANRANTAAQLSGGRGLVPYLAVHDAAAAIDWYRAVFGAVELTRFVASDGKVGHCELSIDGNALMVADEYPDYQAVSPRTVGGTPVKLNLNVPDVDAVFTRAVEHGATARREPSDQAYGERSGAFADPFGHEWMVQTTVATPTNAEIEEAMDGEFTIVEPEDPRD